MTLFLGGGIGHCGTKWLAQVLGGRAEDARVHHELKHSLAPGRWWDEWLRIFDEAGPGAPEFDAYWQIVESELVIYRVVGDMASWPPLDIPAVAGRLPVSRVLYLVRHGVQQLHSSAYASLFKDREPDDWVFAEYFRSYWEIAGRPHKDWAGWTKWEKLCLWWATCAFMPAWLRARMPGVSVEVYRLEDLTRDAELLAGLLESFGLPAPEEEELAAMQARDVNRKVGGDRSPEALWALWTGRQREAFRRVCGPGMEMHGYEVPV